MREHAPDVEYLDCTCGHAYDGHDIHGCFPACGCTDPGPCKQDNQHTKGTAA